MAQPSWALNDTGGGYHLQSFEYENRPLSPFPSAILHIPLVAPPSLVLNHLSSIQILFSNHANQ
jgi:hypothetical protein